MDLGRFERDRMPGELVSSNGYRAFNPDPLPPDFEIDIELVTALTDAQRALSELAGIGRTIQNPHMLIRPFIRKEAVLSSRIEGTRADLSDVFALEAGQEDFIQEPQRRGAREIRNYATATEIGLKRLGEQKIDLDLLKELHGILLEGVRGEGKQPGEFRDRQNFVAPPGVNSAKDARFVPPPASSAHYAMKELEEYIFEGSDYPALLEIGLIHYQLETIHPFLDGNGRIGRVLVTLMMCERELLPDPLLYLSAYFNRNRQEYFDRLFRVSAASEWQEWLTFFLNGVEEQSNEAFIRSSELFQLQQEYRQKYQETQSETIPQLIDVLFSSPILTVTQATEMIGDKTYQAVNNSMNQLEEDEVVVEMTGKSKNRLFQAVDVLDVISKPLEELDYDGHGLRQADLGEYN